MYVSEETDMEFTPAHIEVIHNVACNLHINRVAIRKQERILAYLKDARMVAPTAVSYTHLDVYKRQTDHFFLHHF